MFVPVLNAGLRQSRADNKTEIPKLATEARRRDVTNLGSAPSEVIGALKTSPLLLVVVVLNAGMIFALLYVANVQRDERQTLTKYVIEKCSGASP